MASWQAHLAVWVIKWRVKRRLRGVRDYRVARKILNPDPYKVPADVRISSAQVGGVLGEWVEGTGSANAVLLYLHGGGYTTMSPRTHRSLTSRLAAWSNARLFALDYRLSPEHPFPAAVDDAVAAYRALVATGIAASRIVVAGDSAGGGLALALLISSRDAGDPLPVAAVLFSPWTDLAATGKSIVENDASDPLFFGSWVARQGRHYLGNTLSTHPLASPVYADLTGLPPLLIQVSDSEVLLDDSRRVAEKAERSSLRIWHGVPHGWQIFAPILPEGRDALREAAEFIRAALA